eukprot:CAMPEP_0201499414 /NCGR_PEP_ID=MMETSP0151_2-20130828/75983_1 /ASSEMBLY_ACC=CAM_ASM_000257 /TAXON_ID=200890 /ORGANISM="Paramoeba atlantica, Strain 621/1 / CCAP 1560/9" /LENGTH=73 /DNA_ID=CAMNT_0047891713 /DNA_START=84 /DNA_END=302 /DNA_ORIENTATION=+
MLGSPAVLTLLSCCDNVSATEEEEPSENSLEESEMLDHKDDPTIRVGTPCTSALFSDWKVKFDKEMGSSSVEE